MNLTHALRSLARGIGASLCAFLMAACSSCPDDVPLDCGGGGCCAKQTPYACGDTCYASKSVAESQCRTGGVKLCSE